MSIDLATLTNKVKSVSETYAKRCNIARDDDWYLMKLSEELGELTQNYLSHTKRGRDKGLTDAEIQTNMQHETADLFAHVLLFADHHNIDLETALEEKWFRYLKKSEANK